MRSKGRRETRGNTRIHRATPRLGGIRLPDGGPTRGRSGRGGAATSKPSAIFALPGPPRGVLYGGVRSSSEIIQLQRFRQASYLIRTNPRRGAIFSRRAMQCHRPALGGPTQCISQRPHISRRWRPRNPNGHAVGVAHEFVIANRFRSHTNMVRDAPFRGVNGDAQRRAA